MPTGIIDSAIFRNLFGTEAMRQVFSDENRLQKYLDVEAALARVQARLGIIPEAAAREIEAKADVANLDMVEFEREVQIVGYPILPLVHQITRICEDGAGEYAHWGATTQDIMDSGLVLQLRDAFDLIDAELAAVADALVDLAETHRDTAMAGRTHLQQALPMTFGYKTAIWLASIHQHRRRLQQMRPRVLVGQFAGAVGTLASLGDRGLEGNAAVMEELGLGEPLICWHGARDGIAEAVNLLGLVTGTLGKIAFDVMLLMATELGEVSEPFVKGRGGSSTMPQKRNPISSEMIIACSRVVQQHAALVQGAMVTDLERATGPWHVEWAVLPEAFVLTAGALKEANYMLSGLEVHPERMRANLDMTQGLIVAEAVMMGLAPHIGRARAHDLVYDACQEAGARDRSLLDVLRGIEEVTSKLSDDELVALTDPANYVGQAPEMVDRVLAAVRGG